SSTSLGIVESPPSQRSALALIMVMVTRLRTRSRSWARKCSWVRAGKMICVDGIALSPIKKVSSYSLVSDKHIKIRLGQGSLYGFPFFLNPGNSHHINVFLSVHFS